MPPGGSPPLQSGGQNQRWPTSGQGGYITPATWGSPPLQSGGHDQRWPTSGQGGYMTRDAWGVPTATKRGAESQVAHKWARWLHNPCRMGGSPRLQSGGQNQRWPTSGQAGYITPAAWGVPTASERGGRIRGGPQVGKVATLPVLRGGSPPLQSGGQNQWWPTSGQGGYITPATWGVPQGFRAGGTITGGPQVGKVAT